MSEQAVRPKIVVFDGSAVGSEAEIVQLIPGVGPARGDVECGTTLVAQGEDGRTTVGVWRCEQSDWAPMEMGDRAEFFQVLEGSIVLREDGGEPIEAGPGVSVYSPPGWVGEWRVPGRLKKTFVSFVPKT